MGAEYHICDSCFQQFLPLQLYSNTSWTVTRTARGASGNQKFKYVGEGADGRPPCPLVWDDGLQTTKTVVQISRVAGFPQSDEASSEMSTDLPDDEVHGGLQGSIRDSGRAAAVSANHSGRAPADGRKVEMHIVTTSPSGSKMAVTVESERFSTDSNGSNTAVTVESERFSADAHGSNMAVTVESGRSQVHVCGAGELNTSSPQTPRARKMADMKNHNFRHALGEWQR